MSLLKFEKRYYVKIDGRRYRIVQIGRQWWTTSDLMLTADSGNTEFYSEADRVYFASANVFPDEWRMCSDNDIRMLGNCTAPNTSYALRSISGWSTGEEGGDLYCFNAEPKGYYNKSGVLSEVGVAAFIRRGDGNGHYWLTPSKSDFQYWGGDSNTTYYRFPIRLCKDATVNIGGRDYPTTKIGNQIWLAENLDLKWDGLTMKSPVEITEAAGWYFDNDEITYGVNGNKYGILYNWYALSGIESRIPTGWRVPTKEDWDSLILHIDRSTTALKSTTKWLDGPTGTDMYGFTAYPSGVHYNTTGYNDRFDYKGYTAIYWSKTQDTSNVDFAYAEINDAVPAPETDIRDKRRGFAVRLVMDA